MPLRVNSFICFFLLQNWVRFQIVTFKILLLLLCFLGWTHSGSWTRGKSFDTPVLPPFTRHSQRDLSFHKERIFEMSWAVISSSSRKWSPKWRYLRSWRLGSDIRYDQLSPRSGHRSDNQYLIRLSASTVSIGSYLDLWERSPGPSSPFYPNRESLLPSHLHLRCRWRLCSHCILPFFPTPNCVPSWSNL